LGLSSHWIFYFRSIIYTAILCLIWYIMGNKRFLLSFAYVVFYPFIFIFWKIPKVAFWVIPKKMFKSKYWILLYSYLNLWINLFFSLRSSLLKLSLFLISLLMIFNSTNKMGLIACICAFFFLLIIHLVDRFKIAFSPIRIFQINFQLHLLKNKLSDLYINELITKYNDFIKNEDKDDIEIEKQKVETLQQFVITHQFVGFIKQRLLEFKRTKIYFAAFSFKIISTTVICMILISLINYASFQIYPSNFEVTTSINYFHFIYYTFHSIFLSSVEIIVPHTGWAMFLNMLAPITGLIITVFLITLYWNVSGERYRENIDELIVFSENYIETVENQVISCFNFNIKEALFYLKANKDSLYALFENVNTITQIDEGIKH
jgi:hypothetical protein